MDLTRRHLLTGIAAGAAARKAARAQDRRAELPKPRTAPSICLYSPALIQVGYEELGPILKTLGVEGCDLALGPGGHVRPEHFDLDFERAVEAINGSGVDVEVLSTEYTSLNDPTIRTMAGFAGQMGVPLFRAGHWKYPPAGEIEARLGEVQRDIAQLAALARAVNMAVAIRNVPGEVGGDLWDTWMILRGMDARTVGFDFDAGHAVAESGPGFDVALRLALPRLKMVTARDFYWSKEGGVWKRVACPLGEGMVDWPKLLSALARARFLGPISVTVDYEPGDRIAAVKRDVAFLRKQLGAAYG
jgi:sugar phosphate isomerase/epimerase